MEAPQTADPATSVKRAAVEPSASASTAAAVPCEPPALRLPIVRLLRRRFHRTRLIAIYDTHIVDAVCPRGFSLTEEMLAVEGEASLLAHLHAVRRIDFASVSKLKVIQGSRLAGGFTNFILLDSSGQRIQFDLPPLQANHVQHFLCTRLSGRLWFRQLKLNKLASALLIILGLLVALAAASLGGDGPGKLGLWFLLLGSFLALAIVATGAWLLFGGGSSWKRTESESLPPWALLSRKPANQARPPIRSKSLGWTLKLSGLAYWFILVSPLTAHLWKWLDANLGSGGSSVWTALWAPVPILIFLGHRMSQSRYNPKQTEDTRKPILFLRPFDDDEHTSLQPFGWTAEISGVRPDSAKPSGRTDLFTLIARAHPVRILRMVTGYGTGSSEESLARFFESYGPLIAIGKPGERLASPGASRMYVNDASWQEAILREMERAQAVIMQPAASEGVRWELGEIRQHVAPCKLLLCLVSYLNNPEDYEELCRAAAETLSVDLPRSVPYMKRPSFIYFDNDWTPYLQQLSFKNPILWPVTSEAADLPYTLSPFLEGMYGGEREPARPPRRANGPAYWSASLAGIVLGVILLFVPHLMVGVTGAVAEVAGRNIFAGSPKTGIARAVASSPRITLQGQAVPYEATLPEAMVPRTADNAMIEYWRRTEDSHFEVQIVAHPGLEDLSNMAQERMQANTQGALTVHLDSSGQIQQSGDTWTEVRLTVTYQDNVSVKEICRGTSGAHGTLLAVIHLVESPDTDPVYQQLAEEFLQSLHIKE